MSLRKGGGGENAETGIAGAEGETLLPHLSQRTEPPFSSLYPQEQGRERLGGGGERVKPVLVLQCDEIGAGSPPRTGQAQNRKVQR